MSGLFFLAGILRFRFAPRPSHCACCAWAFSYHSPITQVFLFYANELAAVGGLFVDLTLYTILNAMLRAEEATKRSVSHGDELQAQGQDRVAELDRADVAGRVSSQPRRSSAAERAGRSVTADSLR